MDTRLNYSQTIKQILHDYAEYYTQGGVSNPRLPPGAIHIFRLKFRFAIL